MNPQEIIHWLGICSRNGEVQECTGCPYHMVDDYKSGCGKLLADARLLLIAAYGPQPAKGEC